MFSLEKIEVWCIYLFNGNACWATPRARLEHTQARKCTGLQTWACTAAGEHTAQCACATCTAQWPWSTCSPWKVLAWCSSFLLQSATVYRGSALFDSPTRSPGTIGWPRVILIGSRCCLHSKMIGQPGDFLGVRHKLYKDSKSNPEMHWPCFGLYFNRGQE